MRNDVQKTIDTISNNLTLYSDKSPAFIKSLIDEAKSFVGESESHGAWEDFELKRAETYLKDGFSNLALMYLVKALSIHLLSEKEYAFGFERVENAEDHIKSYINLNKQNQSKTAQDLKYIETSIATQLEQIQEQAAIKLSGAQKETALALDVKNKEVANELLMSQEKALKAFMIGDEKIIKYVKKLEATLTWLTGDYSNYTGDANQTFEKIFQDITTAQKETLSVLKKHQEKIAQDLKDYQKEIAGQLLNQQKEDAKNLKTIQKQKAVELHEKETIEALKKQPPKD